MTINASEKFFGQIITLRVSKYPSWNTELNTCKTCTNQLMKKNSDENGFRTGNLLESEKSSFLVNNSTNFENIENRKIVP